jgi:hypothetical protein
MARLAQLARLPGRFCAAAVSLMRILLATLFIAISLPGRTDPIRNLVDMLDIAQFKAHIKGLSQFGDRMQGTERNRDAIDWLEKQLRSFGYTNVQRERYQSGGGLLENVYATQAGTTTPGEMYLVSAHMDGRGGGDAADDDASGCALVLELARVLATPGVETKRSVRFAFWNNEEFGMDGSGTYVLEKVSRKPAGEPKLLGVIQHDMMMYDHGMPPGPKQSPTADINVEYQANSKMAVESAKLAAALRDAGKTYAQDYTVTIGHNMAGTDSIQFEGLAPSVSVREAERLTGIVLGSNPHHHEPTDVYDSYSEEDFRFGFTSVKMTLAALGKLAAISIGSR